MFQTAVAGTVIRSNSGFPQCDSDAKHIVHLNSDSIHVGKRNTFDVHNLHLTSDRQWRPLL